MPVFTDSNQLNSCMKELFTRVGEKNPDATRQVSASHLVIRLRLVSPDAEVVINGRRNPAQITYGATTLRPDLEVQMSADTLHAIMLAELPLGKALAAGRLKVRGPVMKSFIMEDVFHSGQGLYPQILREQGVNGFAAG
jgi:putative sterol carrier protein